MSVWVVVASKYGATREIAEAIADDLGGGHDAELKNADDVQNFSGAAAVVLGSAIYEGRWLKPARDLVEKHADELSTVPLWLFSSGPIGDPPKPEEAEPEGIEKTVEQTGARGHVVFAGKLDYEAIGRVERLLVKALKAPEGDFRDWDAIRAWAREIGKALPG